MYIVESDFEYKGYRCVVIFGDMGHRCGYVGLSKGHPLYGINYNERLDIPKVDMEDKEIGKRGIISLLLNALDYDENIRMDLYFNVHGSLTYSDGNGNYPVESDLWWLGFDCGHYGDGKDLDLVESYWGDKEYIQKRLEIERQYYSDYPIRSKEYVESECRSLVDQIMELEFHIDGR